MKSAIVPERISTLPYKARVRHRPSGRVGTVVRILENPSGRPQNQWYDVRFDGARYGRFLAKDLERDAT